jgi:hypothetical protein
MIVTQAGRRDSPLPLLSVARISRGSLAAPDALLGEGNGDGLFVAAELWGKTAHQMDDNFSATVREFHV